MGAGKDKESNWMPAPKGPFIVFKRQRPRASAVAFGEA
jgi:hypothetical protein